MQNGSARDWPGLFISFEGGDGVGKSTQLKMLGNALTSQNHSVVMTREPGGSHGAEEIRNLLVTGEADRWSSVTEALLMFAARRDHLEKTVLPALREGKIVISDRFVDSTMAYQGLAGQLGQKWVETLSELVVGNAMPDLSIILGFSDNERALERAKLRALRDGSDEQRFEAKGFEFQSAVHAAFAQIARDNPSRCILIDADKSIDSIAEEIFVLVKNKIEFMKGNAHG